MDNYITLNQLKQTTQSLLLKINDNKDYADNQDNTIKARVLTLENAGYQTSAQVNSAIANAIGDNSSFDVAIISNINNVNSPNSHTIYFVSNSSSNIYNIYDEYMYLDNNWELIGSTQIDLSNYLQSSDIADWAKAANKPTYTASEVGAVPINGNGGSIYNEVAGHAQGSGLFLSGTSIAFQAGTESYTHVGIQRYGIDTLKLIASSNIPIKISNLGTPVNDTDAANKQYVDNAISNISYPVTSVNGQTGTVSLTIPTVPTDVSAFTNDAGYLTSYTETDPTVPAWAKAATKPTYTAAEVGALPDTTTIPKTLSDLATYGILGSGYIDCASSQRYIYVTRGINFHTSGASEYSSYFLLMLKNGTSHASNPVTFSGNGSFQFYNIETNRTNGYTASSSFTSNTDLKYNVLYVAKLSDGILNLQPLAFTSDISAATVTPALSSGTLIATINGTNIYAPAYTDADGVSY